MDHVVDPRPCKICDLLLNSSWNHFCLHQGKNVRVTMEFEVPKRHVLRPTLSTDMIQRVLRWERQKSCFGRKNRGPWHIIVAIIKNDGIFLGGRGDEDKRMVKLYFLFLFQNCLFWAYI